MAKHARDYAAVFLGIAADSIGEAVTDIRHELIERGWFGRELTPSPDIAVVEPCGIEHLSIEDKAAAWDALCSHFQPNYGHGREQEPDHEHELDF